MSTTNTDQSGILTEDPSFLNAFQNRNFSPYIAELSELAALGNSAAALALGHIYFRGGRGVPKNYITARYWWQRVNLEYDVNGFVASNLGRIYDKGLGVPADHRKAFKYLRSASLHGNLKSFVLLAILSKKGDGTVKKPHAADVMLRASISDPKQSVWMRLLALAWLI